MGTGYPDVQLSGVNVLASGPAPWRLVPGVRSPIQEFEVQPGDADTILSGELKPFALTIDVGQKLTVKNLVAISRGVGKDPNLAKVRVVDVRFFLERVHLGPRRYNERRKIGVKQLQNAQSVKELAQVVDSIAYHPASIDGNRKWTARAALADLLDAALEGLRNLPGGAAFGKVATQIDIAEIASLPLEDFQVDDSADNALARMLGYLPGAALTVDPDGTVRVYSEVDGGEDKILKDTGAESVGSHVERIDNSRIRPREIHVLFERKCEVRFDYAEQGTGDTGAALGQDARFLENVVQVPDYQLLLPSGATVCSGTWVEREAALSAWNAQSPLAAGWAVTTDFLRRAMVPYMSPWAGINEAGQLSHDADWVARFAQLLTHYRQTYRINPRWVDRFRHLEAARIGTVDRATGTLGKAVCWADYAWIPGARAGLISHQAGQPMPYAMNIARYPVDGLIGPDTTPAVADVEVVDADQGIVRFNFRNDFNRVFEAVLPSQITDTDGDRLVFPGVQAKAAGPLQQLAGFGSAPLTFDSIREQGPEACLTSRYKAATILTAYPAYPNSEAALHRVVVKPNDVKIALPPVFQGQLDKSFGPALQIKIGANVEVARIAWTDANSDIIEQAFGLNAPKRDISADLESITLNSKPQQAIGDTAASLQAIAHAAAAAAWAAYADHWEGSKEVPLTTELKLAGFVGAIEHSVQPDGRAVTKIELRGPRVGLSMFAYLDRNTRALVMHLART